jgi:predicted Ser/Thr protein kinase
MGCINGTIKSKVKDWLRDIDNIKQVLPKNLSVENILAEGGQGIVFYGTINGSQTAIKIYFPGQLQQRIDREIYALKSLNCSSLVKILWHGERLRNLFSVNSSQKYP